MNAVNLRVEVHCLKPSWVNYENNNYRVYLNDDLLTERTWIWLKTTVIDENIWVNIPVGSTNTVRVDIVLQEKSVAKFALRNLRVIDIPYTTTHINDLTISFTI